MIELFYWPGFRMLSRFSIWVVYRKLPSFEVVSFAFRWRRDIDLICKLNTFTRTGGVRLLRESKSLYDFFIKSKKTKKQNQSQRKCISSLNLGEQNNIITYPNPDVLILRLVEPSNQNLYLKQQGDYHQTLTAVSRKTCNQLLTASCKVNLQKYIHTQSQSAPSMYYSMKALHYTML